MKIHVTPKSALRVVCRYNGEEIFAQDLLPGTTYDLKFKTPPVAGTAKLFVIGADGVEKPLGTAMFTEEQALAAAREFDEAEAAAGAAPSEAS